MEIWRIHLAAWGSLLWLASFQGSEYARDHHMTSVYAMITGYAIGFITSFSGYLAWEIFSGRGRRLLGEHPFWRMLSRIPLMLLMAFGALGFYAEIFGNTPWQYNISFIVAGLVVHKGLVPIINEFDGRIEGCSKMD